MVIKIFLLTCIFVMLQGNAHANWLLAPQFSRGQELVYSGTYTEEALNTGVQFQRQYRLQTRHLVLGADDNHWTIGSLTVLTAKSELRLVQTNDNSDKATPSSVRLEILKVDQQGVVTSPEEIDLAVPVDGPPTLEIGSIVSVPRIPVTKQHIWEVREKNRPLQTWRVLGTDIVNGTTCVKVECQQESDDWSKPRADSTAWRKREIVWLAPQTGIAYRVERIIDRRAPARTGPTHRSTTKYELDSQLTYPGRLFEDRRNEVQSAYQFTTKGTKLLQKPGENKVQIDILLRSLDVFLRDRPPTPYRLALTQFQHRVDAVRRGDVIIGPRKMQANKDSNVLKMGYRSPDFLATDLVEKRNVRLHRMFGQPIIMIFYNPSTENGLKVLRFAKTLQQKYEDRITILGMAVTDNVDEILQQRKELELKFNILDGRGLHNTFKVDATPRMILLDSEGMMRGGYTGWGFHIPNELSAELNRCLTVNTIEPNATKDND